MIRLYVPDDLEPGRLAVSAEQARYLTQVMRRSVGNEVVLFNGRDGEWRGRIAEAGRRDCVLAIEARTRGQTVEPDLELIIAVVKRAPLEWAVEKATELGVRRVRLVTTQRTNSNHVRLERLTLVAIEAAEQTGRLTVPDIVGVEPLARMLDGWSPERSLVFCDETGSGPPALEGPWAPPPAAVLIGPEGGFAPEEAERLRGLPFAQAVSLGPRVLRADTAAVAALTLWQASAGDWRDGLPAFKRTP